MCSGDILPDDIANVAPAAVNSAEKAAARARLKKFMLCGGGVEDIGKLGGMELESFFRITHASIKLFIVCSVLGIPLLAVNWSRVCMLLSTALVLVAVLYPPVGTAGGQLQPVLARAAELPHCAGPQ